MQLLLSLALSFVSTAIDNQIRQAFLRAGGKEKSLTHVECFLDQYKQTRFRLKEVSTLTERCNQIEAGAPYVSVNNHDLVVIVDYTVPSTQRRFFILNVGRKPGLPLVSSYYVSHGRHLNTSSSNTTPGYRKNTIKWLKYYGNVVNSNATSTGFFITGTRYHGNWDGPNNDKRSMVLHGIEKGINDNACQRAVVVHGNSYVSESYPNPGVRRMSSGCFMLDYEHVNEVTDLLKGAGNFDEDGPYAGGALFFTYGPREASLSENYYCSDNDAFLK